MPIETSATPREFAPLTQAETARLAALLSTVSTRTLLKSLMRLYGENEDAGLIVAALLDRFPADREPAED